MGELIEVLRDFSPVVIVVGALAYFLKVIIRRILIRKFLKNLAIEPGDGESGNLYPGEY